MRKALVVALAVLFFCPIIFADGMFFIYDDDSWNLRSENQQLAAINYEDGFENMLISVDIGEEVSGEKAVWVFPVPSSPDKVTIDILKGFPRFMGVDIDLEYGLAVERVGLFMVAYATLPPGIILIYGTMAGATLGEMDDLTVHEKIEKMGLTSELITTKSQEALDQYLQDKGLELPASSKATLDEYVGEDYSFVVSYISNMTQFKPEQPEDYLSYAQRYQSANAIGVFVRFPTERMYFPLKPTSAYGGREIPILLYVVGHVTPDIYSEIEPRSDVSYYRQDSYTPPGDLASFFNGQGGIGRFKYTKIKINTASRFLVEDLWIKDSAPIMLGVKSLLTDYSWLWGLLLFLVLSMAASLVAGLLSFSETPLSEERLMLHGLWNCLTMVGFVLATIFLKTKKVGKESTAKDLRKIVYLFLFYLLFIIFSMVSLSVLAAI